MDQNCHNLQKWIIKTLKESGIKEKVCSIYCLPILEFLAMYLTHCLSIPAFKKKQIIAQIYEVHNTFKQRHFYLTKNTFEIKNHQKKILKSFHVSPFMSLKGFYKFRVLKIIKIYLFL